MSVEPQEARHAVGRDGWRDGLELTCPCRTRPKSERVHIQFSCQRARRVVLAIRGGTVPERRVGAFCLLLAGVSLFMKREMGRRLALWGSAASIVAHMIGALIGLVGGHGVLYGVGFPVAIVLLLRATPSSGLPIDKQNTDAHSTESHDRGVLRAAIV